MCCSYYFDPRLIGVVNDLHPDNNDQSIYTVRGTLCRTPNKLTQRLALYFQRLELIEKIGELVDESFHFYGEMFQRFIPSLYPIFHDVHHTAHGLDHSLHAFCVLGDALRLVTGKFVEYKDRSRTQLDQLRTAARVSHTVAHLLATAAYLARYNLCRLGKFDKVLKYTSFFSAMGYLLWTVSLIWQRRQGDQVSSDIAIHGGGFLFTGLSLVHTALLPPSYQLLISKIKAFAGMIHAYATVQRLMPDQLPFEAKWQPSTPSQFGIDSKQSPHTDHNCKDHNH